MSNVQRSIDTFLFGAEHGLEDIIFYAINTLGYLYDNNEEINSEAMLLAIENGHLDIVKLFYKNGTKITDNILNIALSDFEITEYLLSDEVQIDTHQSFEHSFMTICLYKSFDVLEMFVKKFNNTVDINKGLIFSLQRNHIFEDNDNVNFVEYFMEQGAKLSFDFYRAFDAIAENGHEQVVKYFIQHPEFDINQSQYPAGTLTAISHCLLSNNTFKTKVQNGKYIIEIEIEATPELCHIEGKLVVFLQEPIPREKMKTGLIKELTGNDRKFVRNLFSTGREIEIVIGRESQPTAEEQEETFEDLTDKVKEVTKSVNDLINRFEKNKK